MSSSWVLRHAAHCHQALPISCVYSYVDQECAYQATTTDSSHMFTKLRKEEE
jgi:hypothetical protein